LGTGIVYQEIISALLQMKSKQSLEERLASEAAEASVLRTETGHTFTFKTEKSR
jgi:hypothetical protein